MPTVDMSAEWQYLQQLKAKGPDGRTTSGTLSWASPSSGYVYTSAYGELGIYAAILQKVSSVLNADTDFKTNFNDTTDFMVKTDYASGAGAGNQKKVDNSFAADHATNADNASNATTAQSVTRSYANFPVGHVEFTHAIVAPAYTLLEQGQLVSRTTYADLWPWAQAYATVVSDADWSNGKQGCFSSGDGSTTFRLPDMRGRVPVGQASGDPDFGALGQTAGAKTNVAKFVSPVVYIGDVPYLLSKAHWQLYDNAMGAIDIASINTVNTYAVGTKSASSAEVHTINTSPFSTIQPYAVGNWLIVT